MKRMKTKVLFVCFAGVLVGCLIYFWVTLEQRAAKSAARTITAVSSHRAPGNVAEVEHHGYPIKVVKGGPLRELLKDEAYVKLDEIMRAYQEAFEEDFHLEDMVIDAFETFSVDDPDLLPLLDAWVQTSPKSYAALLARGVYHQQRGWTARGGKSVKDTPAGNIAAMKTAHKLALADLKASLELNPKLIVAYVELIRLSKASGHRRDSQVFIRAANKICPPCFNARQSYILTLEPRWGGSYGAMARFATESEKLSAQNSRLKVLRGFIARDKGRLARSEDKEKEAVALFTEALTHGDHWMFYRDRAKALRWSNRPKEALTDVELALRLRPGEASLHLLRSRLLLKLDWLTDAAKALAEAEALAPEDKDVLKWKENLRRHMVLAGYKASKSNKPAVAAQALDEAVNLNPTSVETYIQRGHARLRARDFEGSQADFEEVMRLEPDSFPALQSLAIVYSQQKKWDDLISAVDSYLIGKPTDGRAYLARGQAHFYLGDIAATLRDTRRACDLGNKEGCRRHQQVKQSANRR